MGGSGSKGIEGLGFSVAGVVKVGRVLSVVKFD